MYDLSLLYGPMFGSVGFGVPAVLTLAGTDGAVIDIGADGGPLQAIDKTSGMAVGGGGRFASAIETVEPVAILRAPDLAGIDLENLRGATLRFNDKDWNVRNHALKTSPRGEAYGEVLLMLTEKA
ncbi:hypothetical protein [Mesorhizobium opportunistum]|uniref:Uncharacterized protein n=1 Tax=Mesorhizobium opportunistum (strain LMG 24607 / HAMBI 3007 / WSM2075) TaxID=536019 RepID=F7XZY0_MESOW|nr:hypothetical protein [Mesorhizobium opportunistum]AEH88194.1 hypothetical protein Mesop_3753 [Mesorhizobium opportunistum WSM2075]